MTEKSTRSLKPAKDQMGKGLDYMRGDGVNRDGNRFAGNHWSGHSNDGRLVNKGRGPTKGNQDYRGVGGPSATKDAYRPAPRTSEVSGREYPRDMDKINYGKQERTPGGTRAWSPSAGQNYKGNPDRINVSGYDMGDGKMEKGSRPVAAGKTDGINYGPKKQY
jgi:hypothetical protein